MKASDLLVQCLENEGVKYVFGVPGEENEDLLFSLAESTIQFIPTRHEQGAAFMADVWGRLTGQAGVCLATLGPGATNLITGVADAQLDKAPLVAITGQGSSKRLHKESHQLIDIVNLFKPITKWNTSINHAEIIPEVVRKAFKLAEVEKPGATHFELPEDIAKNEVEGKPIPRRRVRRSAPDYKALQEAFNIIKASQRPLIIAGNGAIRKLAAKHLRELVAQTQIPVVATFMGKGAVSDQAPQSLFTLGYKDKDYAAAAISQADCLITVGYDIAEHAPDKWNPNHDKKIIHIDFTSAEVYNFYQPAVELVNDISATLWELNRMFIKEPASFPTDWYQSSRQAMLNDIESYPLAERAPFTIPSIIPFLRENMRDSDILISDVGSHKIWLARNYPTYEPHTCIVANGLASMGIALPGAIAAKLANPDKRIVGVMGDGGFLMNSQEIETAKRLGIGFTIIVLNDNDYGLISWKQKEHRGQAVATALTNPDFKKYAESFGIKGYRPQSALKLRTTLKEVMMRRLQNSFS
ncbi:MAG: acetolactate synthase large subunit [Patescibacteria group bacterium]